jgi:hypothetical protein
VTIVHRAAELVKQAIDLRLARESATLEDFARGLLGVAVGILWERGLTKEQILAEVADGIDRGLARLRS